MRRTRSWLWSGLTALLVLSLPLDAFAQRGRGSGGGGGGGGGGGSSSRPSSPVSSGGSQRGSSGPSIRPSSPAPAPRPSPAPSPSPSLGRSSPSVAPSPSRSSPPSFDRPSYSPPSYDAPSRERSSGSVRYLDRGSESSGSSSGTNVGSGSLDRGPVAPSSERLPEPSVPLEPAPGASRTGAATRTLPEPGTIRFVEPVRPLPRVPIPEPYRGSSGAAPTRPSSALRAVDRYRAAQDSGEWEALRTRLGSADDLRPSTARNLDRLMERYERGLEGVASPAAPVADSTRRAGDYRFAYDRGPLDRLARPRAEDRDLTGRANPRDGGSRGPEMAERGALPGDSTARGGSVRGASERGASERGASERGASERGGANGGAAGRGRSLLDQPEAVERLAPARDGGRLARVPADAPSRRALDGLADLAQRDPAAARSLAGAGIVAAETTRATLRAGVGLVTGVTGGAVAGAGYGDPPPGYAAYPDAYWNDCWWDSSWHFSLSFGYGYYGCGPYSLFSWGWGWGWPYSCWWSHPLWWKYPYAHHYYWYGHPYGYGWCPSVYYSSAFYHAAYAPPVYVESEPVVIVEPSAPPPTVIIVGDGDAQVVQGDAVVVDQRPPTPSGSAGDLPVSGAADSYLTLGDRAFREGRYADAVHFYAKATELEPQVGVFSLVLSDALLATGDYGYAAFALRRALEIEPELVESDVDKRTFYSDPQEFDRQLATLELFLQDHPADQDARLVLAANYLFSGAPAAAVDLLQSDLAQPLAEDQAAQLILARAQAVQYGPTAR
jgi:hypothetical protein